MIAQRKAYTTKKTFQEQGRKWRSGSPHRIPPAQARPTAGREKALSPGACLKSRREKLLDDPEALLYCDHEFDRHFAISLS